MFFSVKNIMMWKRQKSKCHLWQLQIYDAWSYTVSYNIILVDRSADFLKYVIEFKC